LKRCLPRLLAAAYPEANKGVDGNVVPLKQDLVGVLQPTLGSCSPR
jgi:hypothetical protein